MTAQRIQRRRTKGWRMPEGAIYVGRPTKWGNPFRVVNEWGNPFRVVNEPGRGWSLRGIREIRGEWTGIGRELACAYAKGLYRQWLTGEVDYFPGIDQPRPDLKPLVGRDLVCWCPIDYACHADVLLELANGADQ